MEDRWLSVEEIAAYIGIKRDTVYKWIGDKNMPAQRMGKRKGAPHKNLWVTYKVKNLKA